MSHIIIYPDRFAPSPASLAPYQRLSHHQEMEEGREVYLIGEGPPCLQLSWRRTWPGSEPSQTCWVRGCVTTDGSDLTCSSPTGREPNTLPRSYGHSSRHEYNTFSHGHPPSLQRPHTQLNRARPPAALTRNSYSQPQALNQLRHELKTTLPPTKTPAWHSQPSSQQPSRAGSRQVSRSGSRNVSSTSIDMQDPLQEVADLEEPEALEFHPVPSYTAKYRTSQEPRRQTDVILESSDKDIHFPTITQHPTRPSTRGRKTTRQNGLLSQTADMDIRTEMPVDAIVSELVRVATNMELVIEHTASNTISCTWKGSIHFQVSVNKEKGGRTCHLAFQWLSGGDFKTYLDICKQLKERACL